MADDRIIIFYPGVSERVEGEGCKSLIPITGAGSAWAILGLVQSR
jgi:hypothetical protein